MSQKLWPSIKQYKEHVEENSRQKRHGPPGKAGQPVRSAQNYGFKGPLAVWMIAGEIFDQNAIVLQHDLSSGKAHGRDLPGNVLRAPLRAD